MRRNWDLIRAILLMAEEAGMGATPDYSLRPGDKATREHIDMVREAGLVTISGLSRTVQPTWAGRDLLDAIRNPKVWAHCEWAIAENGGGLPSDVLMATARMAMPMPMSELG